jgi:hypothetical protein
LGSLSYAFEELPDFRDGEFRSGAHNGCAEISYAPSGEWVVRAILLDCHNGKIGAAAAGKKIPLSRAYQGALWEALCESLDAFSRDHIQDAVDRALTEGISSFEPHPRRRSKRGSRPRISNTPTPLSLRP